MAVLAKLLLGYRYFLFAMFVICHAVILGVAAWCTTLAGWHGRYAQIDAYLIFVGVFALVAIVPIVAIDIFRKNALPSRVWFECAWVAIFWMLELAGASALTAVAGDLLCTPTALQPAFMTLCTATNVLLAFTWLCTMLLLVYLLALTLSAIIHNEPGSGVWQTSVRFFPWYATRDSLASEPSSPTRAWQRPLQLAAPQPTRPVRQATLANPRDLEANVARVEPVRQAPPPPAPVAPQMHQAVREPISVPQQTGHTLYAAQMQSAVTSPARVIPSGATPPPLGDWPNGDSKKKAPRTPAAPSVPSAGTQSARPSQQPQSQTRRIGSPTRMRPVPPPLDLTRISTYRSIDERVARR